MNLTDNQKELLRQLVATGEESILVFKPANTKGVTVMTRITIKPQLSDFDELVEAGFLGFRPTKKNNQWNYTVTNLGRDAVNNDFQLPQNTSTSGDTFTMSGNFQGAIINIKSTLTNTTQTVNATPTLEPDLKEELTQLLEQLQEVLTQVPEDKGEDAEAVAQTAEALIESATTENPNKTMVKISGKGLKQAAKNLAAVTPTVVTIATQIVNAITKFIN